MHSCQVQSETNFIDWKVEAELPGTTEKPHIGVAGPITGVLDEKLIIAGGANFPNGMPWDGGRKYYQKDAYIYTLENNMLQFDKQIYFPDSLAYTANVSSGGYLYTIGGERNGSATSDVFRFSFSNDSLHQETLPSLPLPLTNASAVCIQDSLYVVGGENADLVSANVYVLDLNDLDQNWKLQYTLPNPVTHTMVATDGRKYIWIAGGRMRNLNDKSTMYAEVYCLDVTRKQLIKKDNLPYALAAGSVTFIEPYFVVFGGDDAGTFHQVEALIGQINQENDDAKRQSLIEAKNNLQINHPGFKPKVWALDTGKEKWMEWNDMLGESVVTTTAILYRQKIYIPSGEKKAGVRSNQILVGSVQ